jgi:hypothetical protein
VTGPDVLISGGEEPDAPRRLPVWLRRGVPALVVASLLAALGVRLVHDQRRRDVTLEAANAVDAVVRINEAAVGAGGTVVLGIQVSGRGAQLRVDAPRVRPAGLARAQVIGAPTEVGADTGSQIRIHLQPDCGQAPTLVRVDVDVPITPESGKRHVVRLPFDEGPALVRRACGYLPVDEALTTTTYYPMVSADRLELHLGLRNDGREALTVTTLRAPGLSVAARLPVQLLPRGRSVDVPLVLRVTDCAALRTTVRARRLPGLRAAALDAQVADASGRLHEVVLQLDEPIAATYRSFVTRRCG